MRKTLISLLLFVASAMARGRSGGSRGGSGIDDNWDAPATLKATMAFLIIWFIVALVQLVYIFKNLRALPSMATRGPYIMLAVITLCLAVYDILYAILIRDDSLDGPTSTAILMAVSFFGNVEAAFRPAVILYLIHVRGDVLRVATGNTTVPLSTQIWKRSVDWILTSLCFIFYTASMGVSFSEVTGLENGTINFDQAQQLYKADLGLSQTGLALVIVLCIDVVVSLVVQFIQGRIRPTGDLVISRLLAIMTPAIVLFVVEQLFFDIYFMTKAHLAYDPLVLSLALNIIDGFIRIVITAVLIYTMTIPGVQWSVERVAVPPEMTTSGNQWSTPGSGWNQPLSPNAGWNQAASPPQQPYQQSTFYPPPHPMFTQMQQQ